MSGVVSTVVAPPKPDDISGTLAPGIWAIVRDNVVVDVWDRDPAGRLFPGLDAVDARGTPTVAAGWRRAGGRLVAPDAPPSPDPTPARVVSGTEFLDLFTPAETRALWDADPRLMRGAMRVMAQDSANLDSPELAGLLALAVAEGVLTEARATRIAAGQPPEETGPNGAGQAAPAPTETPATGTAAPTEQPDATAP